MSPPFFFLSCLPLSLSLTLPILSFLAVQQLILIKCTKLQLPCCVYLSQMLSRVGGCSPVLLAPSLPDSIASAGHTTFLPPASLHFEGATDTPCTLDKGDRIVRCAFYSNVTTGRCGAHGIWGVSEHSAIGTLSDGSSWNFRSSFLQVFSERRSNLPGDPFKPEKTTGALSWLTLWSHPQFLQGPRC